MLVWVSASVVRSLQDITQELKAIREATTRIAVAIEAQPSREPAAVQWHVEQPQEESHA